MITPSALAIILQGAPFPDAVFTVTPGGAAIDITADGATITFCEGAWFAAERRTTPAHLSFAATPTAEQVHTEIRRVLAIVNAPADDPLYDRAAAEQALAKVTAERDALLIAESTLSKIAAALAIPALEPHDDALSMVRRLVDGYTVVSQRLVGSQKEVADLESELAGVRDNADRLRRDLDFMNQRRANAQKRVTDLEQQRDEYQAAVEVQRTRANVNDTRATKAEARVKRLLRQRNAAHAVLDEAGIGLEVEGSPRWTLARRCRTLAAEIWDHIDAVNAIDEIAKVVGLIPPSLSSGATDGEVVARVKALHQEDADLARLVSYHQAPIKFNDRPLTLAERAAFVIRRLWQGRTNAAAEAAALRRELGDISDALGDLPDTAEREPIGDREEHLGLSTAERIRLSR